MIYFLLITSLTVSIDSFVCGFSLSYKSGKKFTIVLGISLTVLICCLFTNYAASLLVGILNEKISVLGGVILIGVGLFNLFKKNSDDDSNRHDVLRQSLITGIGVGTDGALANFSLSLMGLNSLFVPFTIAISHALMITLGIFLSKTKIARKMGRIKILPPLVLISLGIYKTLTAFL